MLLDRGEKIDKLQVKSEELATQAKLYKKNATKIKKIYCTRRYKLWIAVILGILALVAVIILILVFWAKVL